MSCASSTPGKTARTVATTLRLYVAGTLPRAELAKANLRRLCASLGANAPTVEIVDVFLEPDRCLRDQIIVTPTLVRVSPKPFMRVLGTLNDLARVSSALGLEADPGLEREMARHTVAR